MWKTKCTIAIWCQSGCMFIPKKWLVALGMILGIFIIDTCLTPKLVWYSQKQYPVYDFTSIPNLCADNPPTGVTGDQIIQNELHQPEFDWPIPFITRAFLVQDICHYVSLFFFGHLCDKKGGKRFMGVCILFIGISSFLTPVILRFNSYLFVFLRALYGIFSSFTLPAVSHILAHWLGDWRCCLASLVLAAPWFGVVVSNTFIDIVGEVIVKWSHLYYLIGLIAIIYYCLIWRYIVYDNVIVHPYIWPKEQKEILVKSGCTHQQVQFVPWLSIFTSTSFHTILICTFTSMCFGEQLNYLHKILLKSNILSSLEANPILNGNISIALAGFLTLVCGALISDIADSFKWFRRSYVRKAFATMGLMVPCMLSLLMAHIWLRIYDCEEYVGLLWHSLNAIKCLTFCSICVMSIELAPNYAGTLKTLELLLALLIHFLQSLVMPVIFGRDIVSVRLLLWIMTLLVGLNLIYLYVLGTSNIQPWNDIEEDHSQVKGSPIDASQAVRDDLRTKAEMDLLHNK